MKKRNAYRYIDCHSRLSVNGLLLMYHELHYDSREKMRHENINNTIISYEEEKRSPSFCPLSCHFGLELNYNHLVICPKEH
jgi:hypothetical protein